MMERPKPSIGDVILLESLTKSTKASCFHLVFSMLSALLWWKFDGSFDFTDINFGAFCAIFIITMKRGFEQENRYTLSKHATEFKNKVTLCQTFPVKMSGLFTQFILIYSKTRVFEHKKYSIDYIQGQSLDWEWRGESYALWSPQGLSRVSVEMFCKINAESP